jgi:hypothetical protein
LVSASLNGGRHFRQSYTALQNIAVPQLLKHDERRRHGGGWKKPEQTKGDG